MNNIIKPVLYVERVDGQYDYKAFDSYTEAQDYADQCSREWMNYWDVVYLKVPVVRGNTLTGFKKINLSELPEKDLKEILNEHNIKY